MLLDVTSDIGSLDKTVDPIDEPDSDFGEHDFGDPLSASYSNIDFGNGTRLYVVLVIID